MLIMICGTRWTRGPQRPRTTRRSDHIALSGGPAPLFLFMAGVAGSGGGGKLSVADARRGVLAAARSFCPPKRGWQIFLLAHLFRFQAFLLNPGASWESLLKPDILNILGLGMAATAWCWGRATSRRRQILWLLGPALAIVLLAPGSRVWEWPAAFRAFAPRLEAYIRPVSGMGVFSVFPWVAFVFVGRSGHTLASRRDERVTRLQLERRRGVLIARRGSSVGICRALGQSPFWTTSISFFLIPGHLADSRGVAWMHRPTAGHWSPLVLFGRILVRG